MRVGVSIMVSDRVAAVVRIMTVGVNSMVIFKCWIRVRVTIMISAYVTGRVRVGPRAIRRAKVKPRARTRPRVRPRAMTVGVNSSVIVSSWIRVRARIMISAYVTGRVRVGPKGYTQSQGYA